MENKKLKEKKLYRWYDTLNYDTLIDNIKGSGLKYYNYTNSFEFAKEHWNIIIEFDVIKNYIKIKEEKTKNRLANPIDYDYKIEKNNIDWYRWLISKWKYYNNSSNIYHYRINKNNLKIKNIYFVSEDMKENIANISMLNRKYVWYNQETFSKKTWIYRSKISEYENKYRLPSIEIIWKLAKFIPINQKIIIKNTLLLIKPI